MVTGQTVAAAVTPAWASVAAATGPGCERVTAGSLAEPVSAVTSLAFVVAAAVVVVAARGDAAGVGRVRGYAVLVAGVGVGSLVQHGPDPAWSDVAHDLPLLATLAFVGADAAADLTHRRRAGWWWVVPTAALLPVIVLAPRAGDLAQVAVAVVAVALTVLRAAARPAVRRRIAAALALLVAGATLGTLSRAGALLCDPTSIWQGHGAWHVLAATALVVLGPVIGSNAAGADAGRAPLDHPGGDRGRTRGDDDGDHGGGRAHRGGGADPVTGERARPESGR